MSTMSNRTGERTNWGASHLLVSEMPADAQGAPLAAPSHDPRRTEESSPG